MTSTVRQETFDVLRGLGITRIFGNPGSTEETFLRDFPADFTYVMSLYEGAAAGIADGYAQATRVPAVVNLHTGSGLGNAMNLISTAFQNRTPIIFTAGQQTRDMLLHEPWLTNLQPETLPLPWVKWAYQPVRPQDVPAAFMRAYAIAVQPPAGPVFLSLPMDDWDAESLGPAAIRSVGTRVGPDPDRIAAFAERIDAAKNPALVLGAEFGRAEDGWDASVALAEALGAPVWAAPASERPPLPEDHPLYVGGLPFAIGPLSERLAGHDLIVVVGAPVFRYYPYVPGPYLPDGAALLHITSDPDEAGKAPVGDSLVSDAVLAAQALIPLIRRRENAAPAAQEHRLAPHPPAEAPPSMPHDEDGELTARRLFAVLREQLPEQTVLVEESPSNLADLHAEWPVTRPDSFYTFASGGLGWGLPASVGVAMAERDSGRGRPVLAVIGDGSLNYSVQALWTAAQQRAQLIVVVPRNGEYAILKAFANLEQTPGVPGLDLPQFSPAGLGATYGTESAVASTPAQVRAAIDDALAHDGPTVIEVPIAATVPPLV